MIKKIKFRIYKTILIIVSCLLFLILFLEIGERKGSFLKLWLYEKDATDELIVATVALTPDVNPVITRTKIVGVINDIKKSQPDVDLIVFGEVTLGCFFSDLPDYHKNIAETIPDTTSLLISQIAKEKDIYISYGMVENLNDEIYNSQILIDNYGKVINMQRKKNLRTDYFSSGQESISFVDIKGVKTGVVICFDIQFPETRKKALEQKTDMIILSLADYIDDWDDKYFGYKYLAKQYNSWIVTANRYGNTCGTEWDGHIEILNPFGDIIVSGRYEEQFIIHKLKINKEQSKGKEFIRKVYSRISLGYLVLKNLKIALSYL